MACPTFAPVSAFTYPISYRLSIPSTSTATTTIAVIAPYNNYLGWLGTLSSNPPVTGTMTGAGNFADPYLTQLLTPTTTSGSVNSLAVRFTKFCVELSCTSQLATIGAVVRILRSPCRVGVGASGANPEFLTAYDQVIENDTTTVLPSSAFTVTRCYASVMNDRSALEFGTVAVGNGAWANNTCDTGAGADTRWRPLVLVIEGSAGTPAFDLIIRGSVDVTPAQNNWMSRLCRPLRPGMEEKEWWALQTKLLSQPWVAPYGPSPTGRSISGYTGLKDAQASSFALPPKWKSAVIDAGKKVAKRVVSGVARAAVVQYSARPKARAGRQQHMISDAARNELRRR